MPLPAPPRRSPQDFGVNVAAMLASEELGFMDGAVPGAVPITRSGDAISSRPGDRPCATFETGGGLCHWSYLRCIPGFERICEPVVWQAFRRKGTWAAQPIAQGVPVQASQAGRVRQAGGSDGVQIGIA
jgi:hypothetical protein